MIPPLSITVRRVILSLSVSTRIPGGAGGTRRRENGTGTARNQTYRVEGGAEGDSGGGGGGARGGGERNTRDRQHSFVFSSARFGSTSYRIPRVFLSRIVGQISPSVGSLSSPPPPFPLPLSLSRLRPARFRRPAEKREGSDRVKKNRAETRRRQIVPIHLLIRGSVNFLRKRAANIQSGA